MKITEKLHILLKAAGCVLLCFTLVVSLYAFANDGSAWNEMKTELDTLNADPGPFARITFGSRYYAALAAAGTAGSADRTEAVLACLEPYRSLAHTAEAKQDCDALQAELRYFENEFDEAAFLEAYEQQESTADEREVTECIEYFDSHVRLPAKGKKLKAASCRPDAEKFYAAFAAEHGEEAGSFAEFLQAMVRVAKKDADTGVTYTSVKNYLGTIAYDTYAAALAEVRDAEKTDTEDLLREFSEAVSAHASGKADSYSAFFDSVYSRMTERYPGEDLGDEALMVSCLRSLIGSGSYDGSMLTLVKAVRTATEAEKNGGFDAFLNRFAAGILDTCDSSSAIGAVTVLWALCSAAVRLWATAAGLLLLSFALSRLVSHIALSRLEKAGIAEEDDVLLRVSHLKQYFCSGSDINKAVDDVSFCIKKGEVFGLVGESGCGKTTTGRTAIGLYDPTDGDVYFHGLLVSSTKNGLPALIRSIRKDCREGRISREEMRTQISHAREKTLETSLEKRKCVQKYRERRRAELIAAYEKEMDALTGDAAVQRRKCYEADLRIASRDNIMTRMQMIFQDPIASINPRMTVREIIAEGLRIRGIRDEQYINDQVNEVLERVGLVREHADRYPHEFSGGQRQRIGIARAIILHPDLIIADEPISALDVSIQAQVINLLNELRNQMGLTILFIAHNLSVVKYFSDRIGVMYYGRLVELAPSDELFAHPLHPYTKSLLSAIPYPDPYHEKARRRIEYDPAKAHDYSRQQPTMREIVPGHFIRCNDEEFARYQKVLTP